MSKGERAREVIGAWNEILIRMMLEAMIEYGEALKELDNRLEKLEGKVNAPEREERRRYFEGAGE